MPVPAKQSPQDTPSALSPGETDVTLPADRNGAAPEKEKAPIPTLERLTTYLRCLIEMSGGGIETVSSAEIERHTGINAAQFRKDLNHFGEFGKPGVGYNVSDLEAHLARILKIHKLQPILLIGAGNLGAALVGYPGLDDHKFHIVAAFDNDPKKIGKRRMRGMDVLDYNRLGEVNKTLGAQMAILAVPAPAAQSVAEYAVTNGVRAILNFAPVLLRLPRDIIVRNVSFLQELAVLSYHLTENERAGNP